MIQLYSGTDKTDGKLVHSSSTLSTETAPTHEDLKGEYPTIGDVMHNGNRAARRSAMAQIRAMEKADRKNNYKQ